MTPGNRYALLSLLVGALHCASARAAEDASGCGHTLASAPKTVQATLRPAYADSAHADLQALATRMNGLMLEIGRCQIMSQDVDNASADKQHDIAEWQSLNQWMYRLTNFVDQSARGDHHMDWKREFELFQDVYELPR